MGSRDQNFYKDAFSRQGYARHRARGAAPLARRQAGRSRELVPPEIALKTNLIGTPEMIKDRLRAYRDAGVTTIRPAYRAETSATRLEALGRLIDVVANVDRQECLTRFECAGGDARYPSSRPPRCFARNFSAAP